MKSGVRGGAILPDKVSTFGGNLMSSSVSVMKWSKLAVGMTVLSVSVWEVVGAPVPNMETNAQAGAASEEVELQIDPVPAANRTSPFPDGPIPCSELPQRVPDLNHEIATAAAAGRLSVMVYLDPAQDPPGFANNPVREGLKTAAARHGARVKYEYTTALPNVINIRDLPASAVAAMRLMPGVVKIEEDTYDIRVRLHDSTPLIRGLQSQITGAGLSATGAGVRVCVADTGIDSDHLMYSTRIDTSAGYDFYNDDTNPEDDHGHGSHVSGIAVGGTGLNVDFGCGAGAEPFQGVAPAATLIGVKILNSGGGGFDSDIIAGINHCANQTSTGGRADVINLSIGTGNFVGVCTHSWAVAANNAVANGVVVVAASGNENRTNSMGSPACGASVISVGATWKANYPTCEDNVTNWNWGVCTDLSPDVDNVVCFSNESDLLDVSAPGANIWSASNAAGGGSITGMSGTSMASPQVAGLAALILDVDPSLTPAQVRQIIRDGAIDLGAAGHDRGYGWGRIDVIDTLDLVDTGCTTNGECDDGLYCNGVETCVSNSCQAGTAPNCNDGVSCTTDSCNESTDSCNNVPNNGACDDGLWCNGSETCNATLGCQAGTSPCGGGPCNETTDTCGVAGGVVWMSFLTATTVPGLGTAENEDIVSYNPATGTWAWVFDGSDVGLSALTIGGMARLSSGNILLSFTAAASIPGMTGGPSGTTLDDSDIVRFVPTTLGSTTAGSFVFYFDGSDVGLSSTTEVIDAIAVAADGRIILSVVEMFSGTGASGVDEDLFIFTHTSLGSVTSGSFAFYFDGSDVQLSQSANEDVDAAAIKPDGKLILSTVGAFSVTGASGADEDVLQFTPTLLGSTTSGTYLLYLDLSALGISTSENINSLEWVE